MITRYHLKDQGQDLLHVDIKHDTIVAAGPFSGGFLVGQLSYDFYAAKTLKRGHFIRYSANPDDSVHTVKYPITKVEEIPEGELTREIRLGGKFVDYALDCWATDCKAEPPQGTLWGMLWVGRVTQAQWEEFYAQAKQHAEQKNDSEYKNPELRPFIDCAIRAKAALESQRVVG